MGARITWTPIGETGTEYVDFSDFGIQRLLGGPTSDAARVVSPAGYGVVLWHDSWFVYELHIDAINRVLDQATWHQLQSFVAHAVAGAEFSFAYESSDTYTAPLTVAAARGATTLTVASTTAGGSTLALGDSVTIEHALDPRRVSCSITGPPTSTQFNISPALHHSMPIGSVVTHFEYFEICRAMPNEVAFTERDAGLGANLWDYRIRFRTLRG